MMGSLTLGGGGNPEVDRRKCRRALLSVAGRVGWRRNET